MDERTSKSLSQTPAVLSNASQYILEESWRECFQAPIHLSKEQPSAQSALHLSSPHIPPSHSSGRPCPSRRGGGRRRWFAIDGRLVLRDVVVGAQLGMRISRRGFRLG